MTAPRRDPLAHVRAVRAARAARAAGVAGTVATVSTAFPMVATPGNPQETAIVATVSSVSSEMGERAAGNTVRGACVCVPDAGGDAGAGMDHDAAERAVMAAHYADEGAARPYLPSDPDPLRDGLLEGFRRHHRRGAP